LLHLPTIFIGLEIYRTKRAIHVVMKEYISRMEFLPEDATFEQYSSLLACLLWVSHARPDAAAFASLCASDRKEHVDETTIRAMNNVLAHLKDTVDLALSFPALDVESLHIVAYADASFANRRDKSSQLGYVLCLRYKTGKMCILGYQSCKSLVVARSAMAAETHAFTAAHSLLHLTLHSRCETSWKECLSARCPLQCTRTQKACTMYLLGIGRQQKVDL
jgi:hypothetical protein